MMSKTCSLALLVLLVARVADACTCTSTCATSLDSPNSAWCYTANSCGTWSYSRNAYYDWCTPAPAPAPPAQQSGCYSASNCGNNCGSGTSCQDKSLTTCLTAGYGYKYYCVASSPAPTPASPNNAAPPSSSGLCPSSSPSTSTLSCNLGFSVPSAPLPSGMQPVIATSIGQTSPSNGEACYHLGLTCNNVFTGLSNSAASVSGGNPVTQAVLQELVATACPPQVANMQVDFFFSSSNLDSLSNNAISTALYAYNLVTSPDVTICDIVDYTKQALAAQAGINFQLTACNTNNCNTVPLTSSSSDAVHLNNSSLTALLVVAVVVGHLASVF